MTDPTEDIAALRGAPLTDAEIRELHTAADCAGLSQEFARLLDALEAATKDAQRWRELYRKAVNEANGLTNYVEDRPELRRAERNLTAIEAEARAIATAMKATP